MAKRDARSSRRTGTQLTEALRRAAMEQEDDEAEDEPTPEESSDDAAEAEAGDSADQPTYRIGEVAQLVGVDAHVLRYWESEFRLQPQRSPSGQRLYRKDDLAVFLRVKGLLHDEGYTIAGARRVLERGDGPAPGMDVDRLKAAIDQLRQLRRTIRALQDDIELDSRW
jgi:DNA-binding transcriptional MerR regulator